MTAEVRARRWVTESLPPQLGLSVLNTAIQTLTYDFQQAARLARDEALEEAAKKGEAEAAEYRRNARICDAAGNTYGGTLDTASALACERVAATIRGLKSQPPQGEE